MRMRTSSFPALLGMTSDLVKAYPFLSDAEANRFDTGRESIGKCPRCGSPVYVGKGNYYCSNKECSFCMWEDNKFFSSKKKEADQENRRRTAGQGLVQSERALYAKAPAAL